ncbi:MAG TPA: prepilin-type N-terminal cleavage/methylation domain-containing protein [Candidatus Pacearchaeota archaeon]|nr:prepilin-type N-terminal cleavage/methylation domain-containing protein [Candidatus Pacearchaeota archaeon]
MNNKSFTLIELLVVIVIIGILAGVIMISTSSSIDKANIAKSKVFEKSVQNNLSANMVSAWDADHVTKSTTWVLNDKWGSNNGTFYDNTSTACTTSLCPQIVNDNNMGNVLSFDGINNYVNGNSTTLATKAITIEIFVQIKGIGAGTNTYRPFIDLGGAWGTFTKVYLGWYSPTNKIAFTLYNGSVGDNLLSDDTISLNTWYHVVATWNGAIKKIFINGKQQSTTQTLTGNINAYFNWIGRENVNYYMGLMKNAKVYNEALSSSQIKQNYVLGLKSLLSKNMISKEEFNNLLIKN